jgi:hypothetical protein
VTRQEIRQALERIPVDQLARLVAQRDATTIPADAVSILDRAGAGVGWETSWWRGTGPSEQRRMRRSLREVLTDVDRIGSRTER